MIRLLVKEFAEAKGLKMSQLSRKAEVSFNTIKSLFRDPYKSITLDTLEKIAEALDVNVIELISVEKEKKPVNPVKPTQRKLRVKELAEERGLNMTKLSNKSDISFNTMKAIFRDPYKPITTIHLEKLAKALEVPIPDLFTIEEDTPESPTP
jgi:DNA-binding Xre family transcriptional regulator